MRARLWFLLAPLVLSAQDAGPLCSLQGSVSNDVTGQPVARAVISLTPGYSITADSAGHFALTGIAAGTYHLQVTRNGFVSLNYNGGAPIALSPDKPLRDLLLRLTPQAVVTGRVFDEEGEPMVNTRIQLTTWHFAQGKRQVSGTGFAQTNDLGEYRAFGLGPGAYDLNASPMMAGPMAGSQYVPTEYGKPLVLTAGQTLAGIDVKMARTRTYHVRGRIASAVPGKHQYTLFLIGNRISSRQPVEAKGDFDLPGVPPGRYTLQAGFPADVSYYATNLSLEVKDQDVAGVVLNVVKPLAVTGRVTVEGPLPLEPLVVHAQLQDVAGMAMLTADSKISADGSFRFPEVSPGRYTLTVENLPESFYVKSPEVFEVGATAPSLHIAIAAAGGSVSGKTSAGATVALVSGAFCRAVTADAAGAFTVRGLPPGAYQAYAWSNAANAGYLDSEYMKTVAGKGVAVTLAGAEEKKVTLPVL
ncbi:MAG TPA: carboxypeptidase-like regulatory domain-containing protein [Candidatus Sulfopaludibacter sp.]|nr:carboxypeptidase-like regulatory domain-containing protein [Candidatus Sulfopaludibacter sp.]